MLEAMLQVLQVSKSDTILTLTSGGCNALNLLLNNARHVSPLKGGDSVLHISGA